MKNNLKQFQDALFHWDKAVRPIWDKRRDSNKEVGKWSIQDEDRVKLKRAAVDFAKRVQGSKNKNLKKVITKIARTIDSTETSTYDELANNWIDVRDTDLSETPTSPFIQGIVKKVLAQFKNNNQE